MALARTITRPLTCRSCQQWILRSFIASVAGQSPLQTPAVTQRRCFVKTSRRTDAVREQNQEIEEHVLNEINNEYSKTSSQPPEPSPAAQAQTSNSQLPWYLQVQQPLPQPESPVSDRQKLPDLPIHPPDLLQPILEHVSIELGMDDLSLLDMRTLDPPPALGANLLMVIGTARSEKHLHVSADRLCRWLRTQYKLSPYPDGLLGRNELKLKLRRKAKRTRLLSAVGAKETAQTDVDDGIRTGWVCVNIGRVPGGELPEGQQSTQDREGVVGFGSITGGSSIVVQLMTEEKRGEVDLEKLWTDALRRSDKRKEKLMEEDSVAEGRPNVQSGDEVVVGSVESSINHSSASQDPPSSSTYRPYAVSTISRQLRAYHTSTRRNASTAAVVIASSPSLAPISSADPTLLALERHISQLRRMNPGRALAALGPDLLSASATLDIHDGNRTPLEADLAVENSAFVDAFYGTMPAFPGPDHYHMHFELLACARQLGHVQMHSPVFVTQLKKMQIAGFVPGEKTFKLVLHAVLSPLGRISTTYDGVTAFPSEFKMKLVLSILEDMEACGYDPLAPDVLELLHQSFLGPRLHPEQMQQLKDMIPALRVARLHRHVDQDDWQAFWRSWHAYPRHFLPRTPDMYAVLFAAIADRKMRTVQEARSALKMYLPQMEMEEPPVLLEQKLARELLRALIYVEPALQSTGEARLATISKEWMVWSEKCRRLLHEVTNEESKLETD